VPFDAIRGQDHAVGVLRRSLAANRVAHAYLFEGIEGCGKMMTALSLVETLFCDSGQTCGTCPSCRKMAGRQHPDLHLLEPEKGVIKIDRIREIQKELSLRPVEAPKKVCIVSQADRMNQAAANAFLKTLEEPPGNALLILLSDTPTALLSTILSRCQRLRFNPLPLAVVTELLLTQGVLAEQAMSAASLAGGSMAKGVAILQEGFLVKRREIVEQVIGLTPRNFALLTTTAEKLGHEREQAQEVVEILTLFYRDVMLCRHGSAPTVNADMLAVVEQTASSLTTGGIMHRLESVLSAGQSLLRNVNPRLTLEALFMALAVEI
jgi:DNA polymerase III subunit delta'